jgi:hypothetical protein
MSRNERVIDVTIPWSMPVPVVQIPETGLQRDIQASPAESAAVATLGGLLGVSGLKASVLLTPMGQGNVISTRRST